MPPCGRFLRVTEPACDWTILWAIAIGYVFWGDVPDVWIVTGGMIVVASGLYILHRQRQQRARSLARAAAA